MDGGPLANTEAVLAHRISRVDDQAAACQAETISFLADPATHGVDRVARIDTPISHIFIAGPRTYKLKRAVKKNFVDYSTVDRRRAMCEREIAVNRPHAPGLYLGVVAIVRGREGALRLRQAKAGDGDAIDYAVEMATFDPEQAFDRLAERGLLEDDMIRDLGDTIAGLHARAPRTSGSGGAAAMSGIIGQVGEAIGAADPAGRLAEDIEGWQSAAEREAGRVGRQLEARRRHGYVRRCHGDLHLGNICLHDGRPTPFDAIEFSEKIASVDVLYDLAFTLMDLLYRERKGQANLLVNRYLNLTRDYSGLRAMRLFVSLRAAVRAMVAAAADGDRSASQAEAKRRLAFAGTALAAASPPALIAVGGLSGSGKSTLARALAPGLPGLLGAIVIRSDVSRKRLFGVAPEAPLPAEAYTPEVTARVYRRLLRDAARALKAGATVILDATFSGDEDRRSAEAVAQRTGVAFTGIWLDVGLDALKRRVAERGADASDATEDVVERQWQSARPASGWRVIDASRPQTMVETDARQALISVKDGGAGTMEAPGQCRGDP